jgi:hypothetical protein
VMNHPFLEERTSHLYSDLLKEVSNERN